MASNFLVRSEQLLPIKNNQIYVSQFKSNWRRSYSSQLPTISSAQHLQQKHFQFCIKSYLRLVHKVLSGVFWNSRGRCLMLSGVRCSVNSASIHSLDGSDESHTWRAAACPRCLLFLLGPHGSPWFPLVLLVCFFFLSFLPKVKDSAKHQFYQDSKTEDFKGFC